MTMAGKGHIAVWVIGITLVAALIGAAAIGFSRVPRTCAVCQRPIDPYWAFKAVLQSGKTIETCCCRCGLRYVMTSHQPVRSMWATDFFTRQWLPAQEAVYVSGSSLTHCGPTGVEMHGAACCSIKTFDRCLPSLVAFKNRDEAGRFQQQYGGQIMTQTQVLASDQAIHPRRPQPAPLAEVNSR